MNQQLLNGLTATLLITALGTATSSYADPAKTVDLSSEASLPPTESAATEPVKLQSTSSNLQLRDVVKIGEYQSQTATTDETEAIAKILTHSVAERRAATLYVRNIPVLTFLGPTQTAKDGPKMGEATGGGQPALNLEGKIATNSEAHTSTAGKGKDVEAERYKQDPVWRATAIAAMLNQLNRENVDADSIKVSWDKDRSRYVIKIDGKELVAIDGETILPDTTKDPARDALQATNRLRRLMGNAPPLKEIAGRPKAQQVAFSFIQQGINGLASWYGPGFDGNMSASGEIFNQYDLTAAHRELPFGTRVRVTNLDNGRSVIVRINDRGPYEPGRVIDLSAGAAEVIGLINSGVAPVRLDILSNQSASAGPN